MPATGGEFAFKSDGTRVTVPLGFFDTTTFDKKKADNMADATKISSDADLLGQVGEMAAGLSTGVPTVKQGELLETSEATTLTPQAPTAGTATADITGLSAAVPTVPTDPTLGQVAATTQITPGITDITAAQIQDARRPQVDISQVEGTVSAGSQATAATQ